MHFPGTARRNINIIMDKTLFDQLVWVWISIAIVIFIVLLFVTAPYGRHSKRTWGITIPDRLGWIIMEIPAPLIFVTLVVTGDAPKSVTVWIVTELYLLHYINRSISLSPEDQNHWEGDAACSSTDGCLLQFCQCRVPGLLHRIIAHSF